jgi:predicted nucleic acid-binding protein
MTSKKLQGALLDASGVLELFLIRSKVEGIKTLIQSFDTIYITPITVGIVFYYAEREKLDMKLAEHLIQEFEILPMTQSTYDLALKIYNQKDMEDGLQVATCLENNIQTIITLDKDFQKKYQNLLTVVGV